jgi:hypothetical protein
MGTSDSWFRALLFGSLLITLPSSEGMAQPAQRGTKSTPRLRLGALAHTLSLPAQELSIRYPDDWSLVHPTANTWVLLNVRADQLETVEPTVRVQVGYLARSDHSAAVRELAGIAGEYATRSRFLAIGGWPALERVQRLERPQPSQAPRYPDRYMIQVTTAVAAGSLLVRLDGRLPSDADQQLRDLVLAIGRSLTFTSQGDPSAVEQEIERLRSLPMRVEPLQQPVSSRQETAVPSTSGTSPIFAGPSDTAGANPVLTLRQVPFGSNGELEIAASNDGANVVMVKQSSWLTSNDGGQTFPFNGNLPVQDGDSSIAFGNTGNFYHSALGCFGSSCAAVCPANSNCAEIAASNNGGQTFGALINAAVCPNSGGTACSIDQEHIAADRFNTTTGGQDRVYMAFRQCQGGCGSDSRITCSLDSGATWAPQLSLESGADFPRVAVGSDGSFYVVYRVGGNVRIDKYNQCSSSTAVMTRASGGFPRTVSAFTSVAGCEVANGFPGLDRCNDGNLLSSPTVAVDDTNANHVYVAWATNTATGPSPGLGNENVMVADSTDGGVTWGAAGHTPVVVNSTGSNGRRIMPWVCASGGKAFVTWYDRRSATAANNDLQDYFAASAGLSGGNLVASNDEFTISTATDATCTTWPRGPRSTFDSENCSVQPQDAGTCSVTTATRCDFSGDGTLCPMGETCQTGNGAVKYGDYNGNYCILGRLYSVFASSAGQPTTGAPRNFYQSFVVTSTESTAAYDGATAGDYHDEVILSGKLTLSGTSIGIAGQTLGFAIGTQSCSDTTTDSGAASCMLTLDQVPGSYMVTASFAGSGLYQASSVDTPFSITKEETTLSYTGPTVIPNGMPVTLTGVLLEDGAIPIASRTVSFTLGTGGSAQACAGSTDASGNVSCTIPVVNQPLGANTLGGSFVGDAYYLASSVSASVVSFAFPARGDFVVGDETATGTVEFWGDDWAMANQLSGGAAPNSFKGFAANTSAPPACGTSWTSNPGNSSDPPNPPLPSYMGVIVSSAVDKSGPTISGSVFKIVVVATNPGYDANPHHHGTGTVVATYCP